jgi:hypothetical protein
MVKYKIKCERLLHVHNHFEVYNRRVCVTDILPINDKKKIVQEVNFPLNLDYLNFGILHNVLGSCVHYMIRS